MGRDASLLQQSETAASENRLCALAADDEPDSREAVAVLLRWCGYDVKLAADSEQALQS